MGGQVQSKLNALLSRIIAKQLLNPSVSRDVENVRTLVLAVVVQRMKVIDHDWIAKELRQHIPPDQVRSDFLEEIFLILIDLIGFVAGRARRLIRRIGQGTCVEYFLVQLL